MSYKGITQKLLQQSGNKKEGIFLKNQFIYKDCHLGLSTSRKRCWAKNTQVTHRIYCQSCQERSIPTPTHFHLNRGGGTTTPGKIIRMGEHGGGEKQQDQVHMNSWTGKRTVTVRVCPFSVGACPIVIFLRNLSLVSNTTGGREQTAPLSDKAIRLKEAAEF